MIRVAKKTATLKIKFEIDVRFYTRWIISCRFVLIPKFIHAIYLYARTKLFGRMSNLSLSSKSIDKLMVFVCLSTYRDRC